MSIVLHVRFCEDLTKPRAVCHDIGRLVLGDDERLVAWEPVPNLLDLAPGDFTREMLATFGDVIRAMDKDEGGPGFAEYLCRTMCHSSIYIARIERTDVPIRTHAEVEAALAPFRGMVLAGDVEGPACEPEEWEALADDDEPLCGRPAVGGLCDYPPKHRGICKTGNTRMARTPPEPPVQTTGATEREEKDR